MPTLIITEPGKNEPEIHRCSEDSITIGRLEDNIVPLYGNGVSRTHAKIITDGENFFIVDLKSGNGTYLNGVPLRANEKNILQAGDLIAIDNYHINFHTGETEFKIDNSDEVTESDILEVKLLKKVLNAIDKETIPSIEVLNGSAEGKKFLFSDDFAEIVIGRDPECDFPINEHVISRRHARISKRWGGIAIRDLESKNGTFLNNRRIVEEYLHDGDRIALGTIVLIFRNPQEINLTNIDDIKPKHQPAHIHPQEIPGIDNSAEEHRAEGEFEDQEMNGEREHQESADNEGSALEEWDRLEEEAEGGLNYPAPLAPKKNLRSITPMEIGMIGLGAIILIFACITIVNLLSS
ncbi:MAG: FHA domain-containing protein [Deltaproteobacteria bacterium]|jgi:pSer/pThr/pTyr-binding forkhead associated (FHA) protein|nr:FHA domain-containing protein [Deltaproteobacteria bacterium]